MRKTRMTILAALAFAAGSVAAESLPIDRQTLEACANTESLIARVGCYDDLAKSALHKQKPSSVAVDANDFGRSAEETKAELQARLGVKSAETIQTLVQTVDRTPRGKLLLSLENGQVWRQLDSARLPLTAGEAVSIQRAALGSYLLEKASGSRTIRVRRVD